MNKIISKISLGTAHYSVAYGVNQPDIITLDDINKILHKATDLGINNLDTGFDYGESEEILGFLLKISKKFKITTKIPKTLNNISNLNKYLNTSLRKSLKRLRRDSVEAILVHKSDDLLGPQGDIIYDYLANAKKNGLTKNIGVSIYDPKDIYKIINKYKIDVIQAPSNVFDQRITSDFITKLEKQNIDLQIRSIFLQGLILTKPSDLPERLSHVKDKLVQFNSKIANIKLSPLEASTNYVFNQLNAKNYIIGIRSLTELEKVIKSINRKRIANDFFKQFSENNLEIIDPRYWQ